MTQKTNKWAQLYKGKTIQQLDQGFLSTNEKMTPFAWTDTLLAFSHSYQQPILHFWQLEQTMILGMKDTRIPFFSDGINAVRRYGFDVMLRNSGGLGVIADSGTLNVSLILPQSTAAKQTIDEGYQLMYEWISLAFAQTTKKISAYEISRSYCPGAFDLSIDGKKFAGLAQRRTRYGLAIMAYLSVDGDQQLRGEIARAFYSDGLKSAFGKTDYPAVEPAEMENLRTLLDLPLTILDVKQWLSKALETLLQRTIVQTSLMDWFNFPEIQKEYPVQLDKMLVRNQRLMEV